MDIDNIGKYQYRLGEDIIRYRYKLDIDRQI